MQVKSVNIKNGEKAKVISFKEFKDMFLIG